MPIHEWSNEKIQSIVAEVDSYWEEYRFSKKAAGLLAFAHLMKPQECTVALRLAAVMGIKGRNEEAVRLGDFALKHLSDPATLESTSLKSYLRILSKSYLESGNHRTALKLATLAKSEDHIKAASLAQAKSRRPRSFHFPTVELADYLRKMNCKILHKSHGSSANVDFIRDIYRKGTHSTRIGWVSDEHCLNELTPDKLGVLITVPIFVCTSEYLRERMLARLPFLGEDRVKVILDTLLEHQNQTIEPDPVVIYYRGEPSAFKTVKEAFEKADKKWVVVDSAKFSCSNPAVFILHQEKPSGPDFRFLVEAQANGAIPVCTATGAIPEYMVGGILIKPRLEISPIFDHEHRKALCDAAVRQASATLAERQHIADEAWKHFSAEKGAMRWLELINQTLGKDGS